MGFSRRHERFHRVNCFRSKTTQKWYHLDWKIFYLWSRYSIYGLEDGDFSTTFKNYFGDFLGAKLEETGKSMTKEDLEKYMTDHPKDKMLEEDIPIIIKNLGREKGRNEGAVDIWKELKNG